MKWKRPLAIAGLILIALTYLSTIIFAVMDSPHASNMLMASLFCTIVVPAVLYAYQMICKVTKPNIERDDHLPDDIEKP